MWFVWSDFQKKERRRHVHCPNQRSSPTTSCSATNVIILLPLIWLSSSKGWPVSSTLPMRTMIDESAKRPTSSNRNIKTRRRRRVVFHSFFFLRRTQIVVGLTMKTIHHSDNHDGGDDECLLLGPLELGSWEALKLSVCDSSVFSIFSRLEGSLQIPIKDALFKNHHQNSPNFRSTP